MISIKGLTKKFDDRAVSNNLNLEIPSQKMTVIIGRSGEGKSVLIKQIVGLIKPDAGSITVDGHPVTAHDGNFNNFGYVFQFAALIDSLTIFENIGINLLENGMAASLVLPQVKQKMALVHLPFDILDKYPAELSGGMRKRVGLARTLMMNPKIILYDEPTTGLDPITSRVVHELMYDMQQKLPITSVVISHDVEIFNYADFVALLHEGQIHYFGDAQTIWECTDPFVYQFIRGLPQGPIQTEFT